jgi:hypothetical protein
MWPDVELHMDKDDNSFKLWITGKENHPAFPYVWREVEFCTLRWWGISLETRKALFDLFNHIDPDPNLTGCFRRISTSDQTLQLCFEEDCDMILSFPLWLWKEEREITFERKNIPETINNALDNLYEAMKADQESRPI